jgi:glycosyltransferase involved in cell wall biosynthesis
MRIAVCMNLAPRKLGSFEGWLLALAAEARRRGHRLDVFGRAPIHADVATGLAERGAGWDTVDALSAARVAGVRRLARYDVLHLDLVQPRDEPALLAFAAWPARVLYMACSDLRPDDRGLSARRLASRALDRCTFARVDSVGAVSSHVADRLCARFGLDRARARVIHNGVDVARFRPAAGPRGSGPPTFVTVAYLIPDKGIDVLLRAFARARVGGARLRIVGDGPVMPDLQVLARELGLGGRVLFVGLRNDVPDQLRQADVFVHPTFRDGLPNAPAEAMACGLPVIASRAGGVPELVEDGASGLLVPPGDVDALAAAIERLAGDGALRAALGESARERVVDRFSVEACVGAHLDWCEGKPPREATPPAVVHISAPSSAAAVSRR